MSCFSEVVFCEIEDLPLLAVPCLWCRHALQHLRMTHLVGDWSHASIRKANASANTHMEMEVWALFHDCSLLLGHSWWWHYFVTCSLYFRVLLKCLRAVCAMLLRMILSKRLWEERSWISFLTKFQAAWRCWAVRFEFSSANCLYSA